MVDLLHDLDFSLHTLSTIGLQQLKLLVNLDCNFLVEYFVQTYSDNSICSLTNSLSDNIIVNVFDVASIGTKLILLINAILVFLALFILVFFDLVSHCMGLCNVSRIMLLLLNVLLDIVLSSPKFFSRGSTSVWTRLTVLARRDSISRSYNSPCLPSLEMSILVLQVCCILYGIIICSKTARSHSIPESSHITRISVVLILLELPILVYV